VTPLVDTALARRAWSEEADRPDSGGAADPADGLLRYLERGADVPREVRLLAARGLLVEDAATQLVLIVRGLRDPDPEVAGTAAGTLASLPANLTASVLAEEEGLAEFADAWLRARQEARSAVDAVMDQRLAARRTTEASRSPASDEQEALDESGADPSVEADVGADAADEARDAARKPLSMLTVPERIKRAMAGSREERSVLVRDPNDTVARAVLSSPKLTENEVESFARMTNVSDEVLRLISRNRTWTRNYSVTACLVRNPKTPPPVSLSLLPRLNQHDIKRLSTDRSVPEPVRLAARKLVLQREGRKG